MCQCGESGKGYPLNSAACYVAAWNPRQTRLQARNLRLFLDWFASQDAAKTTGNEKRLPVRFVFHDDQTSPQVAVKLTHSVLTSRPSVILGSAISAICSVMVPLVKNGPVMYLPVAGHLSGSRRLRLLGRGYPPTTCSTPWRAISGSNPGPYRRSHRFSRHDTAARVLHGRRLVRRRALIAQSSLIRRSAAA